MYEIIIGTFVIIILLVFLALLLTVGYFIVTGGIQIGVIDKRKHNKGDYR